MVGVIYLAAAAVCAVFATLVPASALAFLTNETALAVRMSLLATLGILFSLLVLQTVQGRARKLSRMHGLLAVILSWSTCAFAAALLVMNLFGLPFAAAVFEGMSGLTTTGQTVLASRDALPLPLLFWRVTLEWFGGLLTLACLLQIVAPAGLGGLPQFTGRLFSKPLKDTTGSVHTIATEGVALTRTRAIAARYIAATAILFIALAPNGPPPLEALMLAMTGIATGGFVFFDGPILDRLPAHTMFVFGLAFVLGSTSIMWQSGLSLRFDRVIRRNTEASVILLIVGIIAFTMAVRLAAVSGQGTIDGTLLIEGFFTASALVATSGLETRPGVLALVPDVLVLLVVFAGASLFSTTGGVKLYRIAGLARYAERELVNLIYPHSVSPLSIGGHKVADETLRAIWSYFVFAIVFIALGAFGLALGPFNFEAAFKAAVALFTSSGPLYTALTPLAAGIESGWPSFAELNAPLLLWSSLIMLMGRLEILVVFAALNIRFWMGR